MPRFAKSFCTSWVYRTFAQRILLPWAVGDVRPAGTALEIGSGSGAMAAQLLTRFPDLQVVATDYDPDMVAAGQRLLASFGDRATVLRVDAAELPFEDGRFDAVFSFAMLHHVIEWEKAVSEAVRVLRPGGQLAGYDLLDRAPMHRHGDQNTRMMHTGELETLLDRLPVTDARTVRSRAGLALRFRATKQAPTR